LCGYNRAVLILKLRFMPSVHAAGGVSGLLGRFLPRIKQALFLFIYARGYTRAPGPDFTRPTSRISSEPFNVNRLYWLPLGHGRTP
jgi:hypothetical protein